MTNRVTAQAKLKGKPPKKKIITNRKKINKSVQRKKKLDSIDLKFEQYENILIGLRNNVLTPSRICNLYKLNVKSNFFDKLIKNQLPEYKEWYKKVI